MSNLFFVNKCRERDSNPHNHFWSRDFKSLVSTIPPSRQLLSGCKGTAISRNIQDFWVFFYQLCTTSRPSTVLWAT